MATSLEIIPHLVEEGNAVRAHFQTWWALRNLALPDFYDTMNESVHVQFFHASNSGHYKLIFLALGKIYDSDTRAAGISELKIALRAEGKGPLADAMEATLAPITGHVGRILNIRNQTIVHNEHALSRKKVYEINGITADEINHVIDTTGGAINSVADALRYQFRVSTDRSYEPATIAMLENLRRGLA